MSPLSPRSRAASLPETSTRSACRPIVGAPSSRFASVAPRLLFSILLRRMPPAPYRIGRKMHTGSALPFTLMGLSFSKPTHCALGAHAAYVWGRGGRGGVGGGGGGWGERWVERWVNDGWGHVGDKGCKHAGDMGWHLLGKKWGRGTVLTKWVDEMG